MNKMQLLAWVGILIVSNTTMTAESGFKLEKSVNAASSIVELSLAFL